VPPVVVSTAPELTVSAVTLPVGFAAVSAILPPVPVTVMLLLTTISLSNPVEVLAVMESVVPAAAPDVIGLPIVIPVLLALVNAVVLLMVTAPVPVEMVPNVKPAVPVLFNKLTIPEPLLLMLIVPVKPLVEVPKLICPALPVMVTAPAPAV
jgi:hypothetical protein